MVSVISKLIHEIKTKPWYCIAMILSMSGAYLTSDPTAPLRLFGFGVWLISNFIIAAGFYNDRNWFMVATYVFFEWMNIRGINSNWTGIS